MMLLYSGECDIILDIGTGLIRVFLEDDDDISAYTYFFSISITI